MSFKFHNELVEGEFFICAGKMYKVTSVSTPFDKRLTAERLDNRESETFIHIDRKVEVVTDTQKRTSN